METLDTKLTNIKLGSFSCIFFNDAGVGLEEQHDILLVKQLFNLFIHNIASRSFSGVVRQLLVNTLTWDSQIDASTKYLLAN